ncbi:MAG: hypothetical protein V1789_02305, partial [PVC group bacterium]
MSSLAPPARFQTGRPYLTTPPQARTETGPLAPHGFRPAPPTLPPTGRTETAPPTPRVSDRPPCLAPHWP